MKTLDWDSQLLKCNVYEVDDIVEIENHKQKGIYYFRSRPGEFKNEDSELAWNARLVRTTFKIGAHLSRLNVKKKKDLESFVPSYRQCLLEEGAECFKFSRFHEDPKISNNLAKLRMKMQIDALIVDPTKNTKVMNLNKPVGFINYTIQNEVANLNLGGCFNGHGPFFPDLISSTLCDLADSGVSKVFTEISAANKPVIIYYLTIAGFKLIDVYQDYTIERLHDTLFEG